MLTTCVRTLTVQYQIVYLQALIPAWTNHKTPHTPPHCPQMLLCICWRPPCASEQHVGMQTDAHWHHRPLRTKVHARTVTWHPAQSLTSSQLSLRLPGITIAPALHPQHPSKPAWASDAQCQGYS